MFASTNTSLFDVLRHDVCQLGIKILSKKDLRDMLEKRRSGKHVNNLISYELHRRGIVHYPPSIPMSQGSIIMLAMRGSNHENLLDEFVQECQGHPILASTH